MRHGAQTGVVCCGVIHSPARCAVGVGYNTTKLFLLMNLHENQHAPTIVASVFFLMVAVFGIYTVGGQLESTTQPAESQTDSLQLSVRDITQTASVEASSHCAGTYGKEFDADGNCERSGSTTYTVVLSTSSPPTSTVNAIDDPTPTTDYQVEEGESFQADGSAGNPDGVLENDLPAPGKTNLTVQSWDDSDLIADTFNTNSNGEFQYVAPSSTTGTTTTHFNYIATDGSDTDTATATIEIQPPGGSNTCPNNSDIQDDYYQTNVNNLFATSAPGVLANDSDPDADNLTPTVTSGPSNGSVSMDADGSFTYNPDTNYSGSDQFTYEASDGNCSAEADVTIDVKPEAKCTLDAGNIGGVVKYDGSGSVGNINKYDWEITKPDGSITTDSGVAGSISATATGTYEAFLEVTDNDSLQDDTTCSAKVGTPSVTLSPKDDLIWIVAESEERSQTSTTTVSFNNLDPSKLDLPDFSVNPSFDSSAIRNLNYDPTVGGSDEGKLSFYVRDDDQGELTRGKHEIDISVNATIQGIDINAETTVELRAQFVGEF